MAVKKIKTGMVNAVNRVPGVKGYLNEKVEMAKKIERLQNQVFRLKQRIPPEAEVLKRNQQPRIKFIAHQLDNTGAPQAFINVAIDFVKAHPAESMEFHTFMPPEVDEHNQDKLRKAGIELMAHKSRDVTFNFAKGDVVVLNTMSQPGKLKQELYKAVQSGTVKKIVWYVHEDTPSLWMDNPAEQKLITSLLNKDKLTFYIPAEITAGNYKVFFGTSKNIKRQPYKLVFPKQHQQVIEPQDFNEIRFVLTGVPWDARKGHLPVFYAFMEFKRWYFDKSPNSYRDFEIRYIGIDDNLTSKQIKTQATSLGKHIKLSPPLAHKQTLELIHQSNVTICYSLSECLPIFVFEGMAAGHPLIRNGVSGLQEQLVDDRNGLYVDDSDYYKLVDAIERLLNKKKTSNQKLSKMSQASFDIAMRQAKVSYSPIINDAWKALTKDNP